MEFVPNGYLSLEIVVHRVFQSRHMESLGAAIGYLRQEFYAETASCCYVNKLSGILETVPSRMFALEDCLSLFSQALPGQTGTSGGPTTPPEVTEEGIRGEINLYAGGLTAKDREYDERLGAAIESIERMQQQRLLVSEADAIALCSNIASLPVRRKVSRTVVTTSYALFARERASDLPGRKEARKWSKENFGSDVPTTLIDAVHKEHAEQNPRLNGRPSKGRK